MARYIVIAQMFPRSAVLHIDVGSAAEAFSEFDMAFTKEQRKDLLPIRAINTDLFPHRAKEYKYDGYKEYK